MEEFWPKMQVEPPNKNFGFRHQNADFTSNMGWFASFPGEVWPGRQMPLLRRHVLNII